MIIVFFPHSLFPSLSSRTLFRMPSSLYNYFVSSRMCVCVYLCKYCKLALNKQRSIACKCVCECVCLFVNKYTLNYEQVAFNLRTKK